jgi:hypothetical protein
MSDSEASPGHQKGSDDLEALIAACPEGSIERISLEKQARVRSRVAAANSLIAGSGEGNPPATPDQLEAVRALLAEYQNLRAVTAEAGGHLDPVTGISTNVNIRLRCPKTGQHVIKLLFALPLDLIDRVRNANLPPFPCDLCGATHPLNSETMVIVPYTDEQIERDSRE